MGIPEHDEPKLVKTIDYRDKSAVMGEITEFEKKAANESIENACVVTRSGKVYRCFGAKDRVFPDFDLKDEIKGATISHNHSIGETAFSFSSDDLDSVAEEDIRHYLTITQAKLYGIGYRRWKND